MANANDYYRKREDPYKPKLTRNVNRPLTFFLVVVALIFIMSVFFKVSRIEVKGNSIYTADEVIKASGIEKGDNLFFIKFGIVCSSELDQKTAVILKRRICSVAHIDSRDLADKAARLHLIEYIR